MHMKASSSAIEISFFATLCQPQSVFGIPIVIVWKFFCRSILILELYANVYFQMFAYVTVKKVVFIFLNPIWFWVEKGLAKKWFKIDFTHQRIYHNPKWKEFKNQRPCISKNRVEDILDILSSSLFGIDIDIQYSFKSRFVLEHEYYYLVWHIHIISLN